MGPYKRRWFVCVWMQSEGASFVPSPAVCVLRGLMSKQEEVSDGLGMHLWDTTTGELSVRPSVRPSIYLPHFTLTHTQPHTHTNCHLHNTAAVCLHFPSALHGCSVDSSLLPASYVPASCLHLLTPTHAHTYTNPYTHARKL